VDTSLFWFQRRNQKSNSKEKANSRFLHASYTFCMTKKNLLIGWVSVGQLDKQCQCSSVFINNPVFVIKWFKTPNFTNVELTNVVLGYRTVFFFYNSVSVSNFLRGNRVRCSFFYHFTFVYSTLASTTGRNEVNFELLHTQFQPS
jgi:hypothetical protein